MVLNMSDHALFSANLEALKKKAFIPERKVSCIMEHQYTGLSFQYKLIFTISIIPYLDSYRMDGITH